jgi:glycerol-3-phosphate acyltransferase PlsX
MRLLKDGEVDGVVTAGNTGAAAALAQMTLKRIKGIDRPAIATVMPSAKNTVVLLDSGANVECRPHNLVEFALMGTVYARDVLGRENPVVGLLSIGEESVKGNELTKAAFDLLSRAPLNFHGNVEGRDIGMGTVDVVVCDGFVGNVVLKVAEGYGMAVLRMLRDSLSSSGLLSRLGMALLRSSFRKFRKRVDYAEQGGAPLLGVNGVCVIGHGSSTAHAIRNAILVACQSVEDGVVDHIRESLVSLHPYPSAGSGNERKPVAPDATEG